MINGKETTMKFKKNHFSVFIACFNCWHINELR